MGLINAVVSGASAAANAAGDYYGKSALADDLARAQAEKEMRLAEFKDSLQRRDARAVGSLVSNYMGREVPVSAEKAGAVSGDELGSGTTGLVGDIVRIRSMLENNTDISPEDRRAALAQLTEQERIANQRMRDVVAGQTRKPTLREAARYAEEEALKQGIPAAEVERLDKIARPKSVTVGADSAILTEGPEGRLSVAYENRLGLERQQARDDRADARADRREDARDERLERTLEAKGQLTLPQKVKNKEIDAARRHIAGMTAEEIRRKTSPTTATGRENPDYDPQLARRARMANQRKYGDDDWFDVAGAAAPHGDATSDEFGVKDISSRFAGDPAMNGNRLGGLSAKGREVLDASGKLLGYYR